MNKRQLEVLKASTDDEKKIISLLERVYKKASEDCEQKIAELAARSDLQNIQSIVYQTQYQQAMKKQLDGILDTLHSQSFEGITDYLGKCYENGFYGTLYDLHGQGCPVMFPIDQRQVVKALQTDAKLSKGMYSRLGDDVSYLKKSVRAELSRGISEGSTWVEMASRISKGMNSPFKTAMNNSMRIARTEGHRIQNQAQFDTITTAKSKGADVVKQWDATLDKRTRRTHRQLDGQIRELDEPFEVDGKKAMYPGGFGIAKEDIHCRCAMLQRARWSLDEDELNELKDRAAYYGLDKTKDFEDFKQKFKVANEQETRYTDNKYTPKIIGGVKRGSPMTFEDADSYHVNPGYGTSPGYSINCQSCVVTFEARQRGYDVKVLPNTKGSALEKLSYQCNSAWIDPATGKAPDYLFDNKATTPKKYLSFMQDTIEQGNRYTIEFSWKGRRRSGHIVNLDRTTAGELRIKDNQRGVGEKSEWVGDREVLAYLSRLKYTGSTYGYKYSCVPKILRIDNMYFNEDVVNKIMEGV